MNNETMAVTLPVLPIKRTVLFPGVMMPLTVGRGRSIAAIEAAMKTEDKTILVVAQRDPGGPVVLRNGPGNGPFCLHPPLPGNRGPRLEGRGGCDLREPRQRAS